MSSIEDELEALEQGALASAGRRQKMIADELAALDAEQEVQQNPRTRGYFVDVAAGAVRGPIRAFQAAGRLTQITGDLRIDPQNLFSDDPVFRFLSPSEVKALDEAGQGGFADSALQVGQDALGAPQTIPGTLSQGITQFLTGFKGAGTALKAGNVLQQAGKAVTAIRGLVASATSSFAVFEAQDGNLANLINVTKEEGGLPDLSNALTEALAVDGDDGELQGRLKNALADAGLGVAVEGVIKGVRSIKTFRNERAAAKAEQDATPAPDEALPELRLEGTPKFTEDAPAAPPNTPEVPPKAPEAAPVATPKVEPQASPKASAEADEIASLEAAAAKAQEVADGAKKAIEDSQPVPMKDMGDDELFGKLREDLGITEEKLQGLRDQIVKGEIEPEKLVDLLGINPDRINWQSVTDAEDMVGLLNAMTRITDEAAGKAGYARVSVETTAKLADEIGGSMREAVGLWQRLRANGGIEAGILAQRTTLMASAARLQRLAKTIAGGKGTAQDMLDFIVHDRRHSLLQVTVRGSRATIGRALRIMREGVNVSEGALKVANGRRMRAERKAREIAGDAKEKAGKIKERSKKREAVQNARQQADEAEQKVTQAADEVARKKAQADAKVKRKAAQQAEKDLKAIEEQTKDLVPIGRDIQPVPGVQLYDFEDILKQLGMTADDVAELARRYVDDPDSLGKVNQVSRSSLFNEGVSRLAALYINNILSGLPTMAVNITSGLYKTIETIAENFGSVSMGFARGGDRFDRMVATKATAAAFSAWRSAWGAAGKAFKDGMPVTDALSRNELAARGGLTITGVKPVDAVLTLPSRTILTIDEFFKHIFYKQELTARAVEVAASAARLAGKDADKVFNKTLKETLETPPDDLVLDAIENARYNTFQSDLESAFGKNLIRMSNETPIMKFVVPFIKTPLNILKQGFVERTPLALASKKFWQQVRGGGREGRTAVQRMLLGSMGIGAVWALSAEGNITGSRVGRKGTKNTADMSGAPPYSIRIGDTWYQYNRLDPIGTVLGLTADLRSLGNDLIGRLDNEIQSDDAGLTEAFGNLVVIFQENISDKTFFKGFSDLMEVFNSRTEPGAGTAAAQYVANIGSNLVPYSSMTRNFARTHDEYAREAWSLTDKLMAQLPGLSDNLPLRRDLLGRPIENTERLGADWVSPFLIGRDDPDPAARALAELTLPYRMPDKDIAGVQLTSEQYSKLLEVRGEYIRQQLMEWLQASEWQQLTEYQRRDLVRRWMTTGSRQGEAAVFEGWPEVEEAVQGLKQEALLLRGYR